MVYEVTGEYLLYTCNQNYQALRILSEGVLNLVIFEFQ